MTREPKFFKRLFQCNIEGQYRKILPTFTVSIGHTKETDDMELHPFSPTLECR